MNTITHLECSLCGKRYEAGQVHNLCTCGGPLLVRYDLAKAKADLEPRRSAVRAQNDVALCSGAAGAVEADPSCRWAKA